MKSNKTKYADELSITFSNCESNAFSDAKLAEFEKEVDDLLGIGVEEVSWFCNEDGSDEHYSYTIMSFGKRGYIVVKTLNKKKKIFVNIFSCKEIDVGRIKILGKKIFSSSNVSLSKVIERN